MFSEKHYIPAIKWRQGEREALKELQSAHKAVLTPLVDIPTIPWDFEEERSSKSIDQHLNDVPQQMAECWGTSAPIFLDLGLVEEADRMRSGRHPLDELFERLSAHAVQSIPVTGTDRGTDYQNAVRTVGARDRRGACIRAKVDDLANSAAISALDDLSEEIGVALPEIDLVLDFRSIEASHASILGTLVTSTLTRLPNVNAYRTLTLLSGAFPVNLSSVPQGLSLLPRADWALWLSVRSSGGIRVPSYGDYTASHPDQEEIDPRFIQVSASIRYAADTDWVVARGRSVRNPRYGGYSQYNALSTSLMAHPLYTGSNFSWASDFIAKCAGGVRTGNPMQWRKVATNRHMARVAHQIANLP